ncbi:MAG: glycosyltransferase family 2 protein [Coleofasciculaceae cyanobacterium RL_1_1]|nr:glycosyltransferase family 2 protein [Coleofasciculaceae cyanobacterium RL_1_1]
MKPEIKPIFSVVITTFNRRTLLKKAVHTALGQTYPCEVIIVDDCSEDGTEAWVKKIQSEPWGERVQYIRNSVNLGHSGSINRGVAIASGNWIKFLDDDYLAPNCLEQIAEAITLAQHQTSEPIALCSVQAIQEHLNGKPFRKTRLPRPIAAHDLTRRRRNLGYLVDRDDVHYNMLIGRLPFGTPVQVACSRQAFDQVQGWNPQFNGDSDDIEFWVRAASTGAAIVLHAPLAYRTHGAHNISASLSEVQRFQTNWMIKQNIFQRVSSKYQADLPSMSDLRTSLEVHWGLVSLKNKHIAEAIALLSHALRSPSRWWKYAVHR